MKKAFGIVMFAVLALILVLPAYAQINVNYIQPTTFALKSADVESTVIKIIQWALQLLGLIAVIMIIAAVIIGATTSDSDRAAKAKAALVSAISVWLLFFLRGQS